MTLTSVIKFGDVTASEGHAWLSVVLQIGSYSL